MATMTTPPDGMTTPPDTVTITEPSASAVDAFVADRQAFWGSFTSFVTMAASGIAVLLILMAIFLG